MSDAPFSDGASPARIGAMDADRRFAHFSRASWGVLLLIVATMSCGTWNSTVRGFGKNAAEGFADGIPAMKEPTKKVLRDMLLEGDTLKLATDQAMTTAVRSLTRELADSEVQKRVDGLVEHTLQVLAERGGETTQTLLRSASPELRAALRTAVVNTMNEAAQALEEAMEKKLQPATERLARHTADVLAESLIKAIDGPLGKKLDESIGLMGQHLIGHATLALGDPASKQAIAEFTESATRGAVRGAKAGVSEGLPPHLQTALIAGLVVVSILMLLFAIGGYSLWHRYQQSTTTLAIIAEKINQQEQTELKQAISKSAEANHVGPWLSRFLKSRGL